jgi:hypothetical protein
MTRNGHETVRNGEERWTLRKVQERSGTLRNGEERSGTVNGVRDVGRSETFAKSRSRLCFKIERNSVY